MVVLHNLVASSRGSRPDCPIACNAAWAPRNGTRHPHHSEEQSHGPVFGQGSPVIPVPMEMGVWDLIQGIQPAIQGQPPLVRQAQEVDHQCSIAHHLRRWNWQSSNDAQLLIELATAACINGKVA